MKTNMQSQVTNGMFLLNKYSESPKISNTIKEGKLTLVESKVSIIESIIETLVEPIIFKC
jgi:hypothetical protein